MPRSEDNIKIDHKAAGCSGVDWIHQDQDRVQWWVNVEWFHLYNLAVCFILNTLAMLT